MRVFLAIELTPQLRLALSELQSIIKKGLPPVSWVRPESIHLTLKFLGETDESLVDELRQAVSRAAAGHAPFSITIGGLGVFPNARAPRILWVGLEGELEALRDLAAEVEQACEALGFPSETRPFNPHLTLARIKQNGREVGQALARRGVLDHQANLGTLRVEAVVCMQSDLKPTGAVYTRLWEAPLNTSGSSS